MNRTILEQYRLLTEKKDHIINKLANLSDEEKQIVIDFFKSHANLENKIDWNNKDLSFDDFKEVMKPSKTAKKKAVSRGGIEGLEEGVDYVNFPLTTSFVGCKAYIPINHTASKLIASTRIGGCEGKWCTAYNGSKYWNDYVNKNGIVLIYIIYIDDDPFYNQKYAVAVSPQLKDADKQHFEIFNKEDKSIDANTLWKEAGINIEEEIEKHIDIIKSSAITIQENRANETLGDKIDSIEVTIMYDDSMSQENFEQNFKHWDDDKYIYTHWGQLEEYPNVWEMVEISDDQIEKIKEMMEKEFDYTKDDWNDPTDTGEMLEELYSQYDDDYDEIRDLLDHYGIEHGSGYSEIDIRGYSQGDFATVITNKWEFRRVANQEFDEYQYKTVFEQMFFDQPVICRMDFDGDEYYHEEYDNQYIESYDEDDVIDNFFNQIEKEYPNMTDDEREELREKLESEVPDHPAYR